MRNQGLRGKDKQQADLQNPPETAPDAESPEGLRRQRQGPYDKDVGRIYEDAARQPPSPGQPAKGE